jgi:hypothetical protein
VNVEREGDGIRITLAGTEVHLLRRALEKASFIDIPRDEQPAVAAFCTRALEQLAAHRDR